MVRMPLEVIQPSTVGRTPENVTIRIYVRKLNKYVQVYHAKHIC